jgi:hypothetical protein
MYKPLLFWIDFNRFGIGKRFREKGKPMWVKEKVRKI